MKEKVTVKKYIQIQMPVKTATICEYLLLDDREVKVLTDATL